MDSEASDTLYSEPTGINKWVYNTLAHQMKDLGDDATASEGSVAGHHYLQTTAAQPKGVLQDCPHADDEGIFNAFSANAVLGIRSLPNALAPDYRQQLFTHLVQAGKERQATLQQQHQQQRQSTYRVASCSGRRQQQRLRVQIPSGTKSAPGSAKEILSGSIRVPHRYSPTKGQFSTFEHVTSEYERSELVERFAKLQSKLAAAEVSPEAFVVRGCPLPAPHTPTFSAYHLAYTPYQEVDHLGRAVTSQQEQRQHLLHGAFVPAGRSSSAMAKMRAESADMLQLLETQLTQDWPRSFLKAFIDSEGCVVVSFDRSAAAREGDVSSYMNNQSVQGELVQHFRLTKDPNRWGVVEGDSVSVFYVLSPPWRVARPDIPEELQGYVPPWERPPHETSPAHGFNRNPFGTTTAAGVYLNLNTRLFERTVDTR